MGKKSLNLDIQESPKKYKGDKSRLIIEARFKLASINLVNDPRLGKYALDNLEFAEVINRLENLGLRETIDKKFPVSNIIQDRDTQNNHYRYETFARIVLMLCEEKMKN